MSQRQFFSISDDEEECDAEFDLSTMTAMDYLKRVRYERKQIQEIVTVRIEKAEEADNQAKEDDTDKYKDFTKEFGEIQISKFQNVQNKIQAIRSDPRVNHKLEILDTPELDNAAVDAEKCIAFCKINEPKLSFCLALSQNKLEDLLEALLDHFQLWIDGDPGFEQPLPNIHWMTKWIYATLCCLHFPLEPNLVNALRSIARICIRLRNSLKSKSESTSESILPFNLIICLIALNFRQFDLLSL